MDSSLLFPILGVAAFLLAFAAFVAVAVRRARRARSKAALPAERPAPVEAAKAAAPAASEERAAAPVPLSDGLARTRGGLMARLGKFLGRSDGLAEAEWLEIEEALLEGDVGPRTVSVLLERVKARAKTTKGMPLADLFREESEGLLSGLAHGVPDLAGKPKPYVISIVGVNGVGKTTTIGKLSKYFRDQGRSVLMGATDTFRAAAIQQLRVWSERTGSQLVAGREGGDPGAVAFDAVSAGKAREIDVVLLDTAGRLHTKVNLMDELKKVHRVVKKVIPEAPHETWLVVDGTAGQNSIHQAREFGRALEVTGVIVTKLDGTAKGGALLAIASELKLPIRFIGIGEQAADLIPFEAKPFVHAILSQ